MTHNRLIASAAMLAAALSSAAPAAAQIGGGGPGIRLGLGGGLTVPVGDARSALQNGVNGQAFVLVNTGVLPPLRFNVGYQRFGLERSATPGTTGETSILSGVAGLTVNLLQLGPLRPYITGGLGAFNISNDVAGQTLTGDDSSQTRFGIDGGAGLTLRLGRMQGFIEGRVQNVYTEAGLIDASTVRYVPVTFGILF